MLHQDKKGLTKDSQSEKKIGYPASGKPIPESKADFFVALLDRHILPVIFIISVHSLCTI
jgi:hypothetical protein